MTLVNFSLYRRITFKSRIFSRTEAATLNKVPAEAVSHRNRIILTSANPAISEIRANYSFVRPFRAEDRLIGEFFNVDRLQSYRLVW